MKGMLKGLNTGIMEAIILAVLLFPLTALAGSPTYAWLETSGWINFQPSNGGVTAYSTYLTGYAWAENIGWVKLGSNAGGPYANTTAANWGVNRSGTNLSGYVWSETAGWINFHPTHSQVTINSATGALDGYAWAENAGWIHFRNTSPAYGSTVNIGPSITSANSTSFTIGSAGSFTVTTTGYPAPSINSSGSLPGGVTFTDNADGTATLGGTSAAGTAGTYPLTFTAGNSVLPNATQTFTLTVAYNASTTSANSSLNPSNFGQAVTFTATVSSGAGTPTGTVTFNDGATTLGTGALNGAGQTTFLTSTLTAGSHSITAVYGGDVSFGGSTSTAISQTVNAIAPTVSTAAVSGITSSSASSGGNVTSDGGSPVTARGICYGTSPNPTIAGSHTTDGTGAGSFISSMSGLAQNTIYHVRAYATNGMGTSYGSDISFTTGLLTHMVIAAATGNGNITLETSSPGCGFTTWGAKTEAQVNNDPSYDYPFGLVEFTLNCAAADVTITFPGNIAGTTYRKYGPTTPGNPATTAWYTFNNFTVNSSTSITLHFHDGQLGDDTGVDGIIVDEGGPGQSGGNDTVAVPAMTEWGLIIFMCLAGLGSMYTLRQKRRG